MLLKCLNREVIKKCNGLYYNFWFLIVKKVAGLYRLINAAIRINSIIIRDINLSSFVNEFFKEFVRY